MRQLLACSVWVQAPAPLQRSLVHDTPSLAQAVALDRFVQADVDEALWHDWQSFRGFLVDSE
jgi:hypothetical protein